MSGWRVTDGDVDIYVWTQTVEKGGKKVTQVCWAARGWQDLEYWYILRVWYRPRIPQCVKKDKIIKKMLTSTKKYVFDTEICHDTSKYRDATEDVLEDQLKEAYGSSEGVEIKRGKPPPSEDKRRKK